MSEISDRNAERFLREEKEFHLGFLPTEQSHPLTKNMESDFLCDTEKGVRTLQSPDRAVLEMARRVFKSAAFSNLVDAGMKTLDEKGRIVFSGCGATGRLSILLEAMLREYAEKDPRFDAASTESIMTGGDFALGRAVEFFEDYQSFGRRQVADAGMGAHDMLLAITEGGETSSVIGTVKEAADRGCRVFLMFNNPAELLRKHLARCREVIDDPRVTILDLSCGPMALAGSTRMQATTSEELIAGAFLETLVARRSDLPEKDFAAEFEKLLDHLESDASVKRIADQIDFETETYRGKGRITYFADAYLLDLFTDTAERTPTFMLPPFKLSSMPDSPEPWAFVKNPTANAPAIWERTLHRPPRCLEWTSADYRAMNAPESIIADPPKIGRENLFEMLVGKEACQQRFQREADAAVLVTVDRAPGNDQLRRAAPAVKREIEISSGCDDTPLHLMDHLAVKLVLNTISTGTMVKFGRVAGNWMSWVNVSNKKLIDRAIRLISDLGKVDYEYAWRALFESIEEMAALPASQEKPSPVQYTLRKLREK
ncbi:MAG: hypothetical protein MJ016_00035 [Victivallaceae bacterium]|nr:hypothetical protein [Victivallaceae bacterium]